MPRSNNGVERTKKDKTPLRTRGRNVIGENGIEQIKTRSSHFDFMLETWRTFCNPCQIKRTFCPFDPA